MKINIPFLLAFAAFATIGHSQIITNFGTSADNGGSWTYNSGTSTITGTEGGGDLLFGLSTNTNLTGAQGISLTATYNTITPPAFGFSFIIQDNLGRSASALFDWSAFIGGATVYSTFASVDPGFNFAQVTQEWNLLGGGSGSSINVTLASAVAAVPEPTTMVLLAGSLTAVMALRRRRNS